MGAGAGATTDKDGIYCDYKGMHAFWRGLKSSCLSDDGKKSFALAAKPDSGYYMDRYSNPYQLGYIVDNQGVSPGSTPAATATISQS
ncbi:MAG: hypothetical protein R3B47_12905 [Bacteroidia bacterium]